MSQSIKGTRGDAQASAHTKPLVRNSLNCTYAAPRATSTAKIMRPARESGVVLGSEIMKKLKSRNAPPSSRCSGMVIGSLEPRSIAPPAARPRPP